MKMDVAFNEWSILILFCFVLFCFFFNDTATTEIYTLSLHDALPICEAAAATLLSPGAVPLNLLLPRKLTGVGTRGSLGSSCDRGNTTAARSWCSNHATTRSEEHTSELQSPVPISYAVFCLKKKKTNNTNNYLKVVLKFLKHTKPQH